MSQFNNTNDPFGTHTAAMNTRARAPAPGHEMTNLGGDPFMTNNLSGAAARPQIRVRMMKAVGLPRPRSTIVSTRCQVSALNKPNSMIPTNDSADPENPEWNGNMSGTTMVNWVPGDRLKFQIMQKDQSGCFSGMGSPELVGQAEIAFDQYFPWGFGKGGPGGDRLPLTSPNGRPIEGAYLYVQIECLNVGKIGFAAQLQKMCCGGMSSRQCMDGLRHLPDTIIATARSTLGEPADGRNKSDLLMLIAIPYCLYLLIAWLGWLLYHFCNIAMTFIIGTAVIVSLGLILVAVTTQKKNKKPLFALGCLALIAVFVGVSVSNSGWNSSWEQWWWMQTGRKTGASAGTPAPARSDAAVISFATVKNGTAWTSVDATRAAGYRHGDVYCAAPILDPKVALGDIVRVEYWAIGINCCDDFGSFTCDQSRESVGGGTGVVMKDGGMPCAGCHAEQFRLATAKASGVNGMVSAPGALFVRYVSSAKTIEHLYLGKCMFSLFWSLILGMLIFGILGFITNYKGFGKTGRFPLYHLLDDPKPKHDHARTPEMIHKEPIVYHDEKPEWNIILTQGPNNTLAMAATHPEDNHLQTQYGAF